MFDITKYVQLKTSKQKKQYLGIRILFVCIFIVTFILFTKELIFPTQIFNFDNSIDSLANTISKPYESQKGTSFHITTQGESDSVVLTITLPKDLPKLPNNTTLLIKKSYLAFLSPINTEKYTAHEVNTYEINNSNYINNDDNLQQFVSENAFNSYLFKNHFKLSSAIATKITLDTKNLAGFAPATLISSKNSIYVTDGTVKHPIQDERAFKSLGYNFDNVIKTNSEERSLHKNAKLFTVKSTHPFGTLFYTTDGNRTFIFDNNLINKISTTDLSKQHSILAQEASRITTSSCIFKKTIFPRQYKCTTSLSKISNFDGNTYQFTLNNAPNTKIDSLQIKLFTTPNKQSIINRIESLKRRVTTTY
jgi:hypothetical protein